MTRLRQECPVCNCQEMEEFFQVESAPVFCNVLWNTKKQALAAPSAPINLSYCRRCGLIYNIEFDSQLIEYSGSYENSLHFSPRFQKYAEELAERLIEKYQLRDKDIIEIGCGGGDFLAMLQRRGNNRVLGFDPSYTPRNEAAESEGTAVTIISEVFGQTQQRYPADFICCRHVLEHIEFPLKFLRSIRETIGDCKDCIVYFEVPNALYTLRDMGVWDIIYEHCCYFTSRSLANLFVRAGFELIEITERYDGQFLGIEARPCTAEKNDACDDTRSAAETDILIEKFRDAYNEKVNFWKQKLPELVESKSSVVVWGAGSKGVSFLNALEISSQQIEYIVDINTRKNGRFVPGTGQQVVGSDFLKEYRPQTVIVMNPIYSAEIRRIVHELRMSPEFLLA